MLKGVAARRRGRPSGRLDPSHDRLQSQSPLFGSRLYYLPDPHHLGSVHIALLASSPPLCFSSSSSGPRLMLTSLTPRLYYPFFVTASSGSSLTVHMWFRLAAALHTFERALGASRWRGFSFSDRALRPTYGSRGFWFAAKRPRYLRRATRGFAGARFRSSVTPEARLADRSPRGSACSAPSVWGWPWLTGAHETRRGFAVALARRAAGLETSSRSSRSR